MASRAILVTGGTGTLGSEIVRVLCADGIPGSAEAVCVFANYSRDDERASRLADESGCALVRADVGIEAEVTDMFEQLPPLFAVVHAAGLSRDALLLRQSREGWDRALRINLDSAFLVARAALEKLQDGGRLIFLASRVGQIGKIGQSAYGASKAGVLALARVAAREGAARHLTVNAICPGWVPSAMNEYLPPQAQEAARGCSVLNELGKAQETAGLVRWLLSPEAAGVSGQTFHSHSRI